MNFDVCNYELQCIFLRTFDTVNTIKKLTGQPGLIVNTHVLIRNTYRYKTYIFVRLEGCLNVQYGHIDNI